jgi:hypothetical protein
VACSTYLQVGLDRSFLTTNKNYHSTFVPSPVLVNFHGSGFIVPLHGSDDEFARLVVQYTDNAVLDVVYRLYS